MTGAHAEVALLLNGEQCRVPAGASVADMVARLGIDGPGFAAALNGEVVPRSAWTTTRLGDGDRLEVLGAAQGG